MRILICKNIFCINVIFFFSGKNIFWEVFFMCVNLVKSQKVIKIFEKLFLHVMLTIIVHIIVHISPKELSIWKSWSIPPPGPLCDVLNEGLLDVAPDQEPVPVSARKKRIVADLHTRLADHFPDHFHRDEEAVPYY